MSGSGGFYKYRCKNFYSHNCPNWVWVNNSPCAICIAEGRDETTSSDVSSSCSWSDDVVEPPMIRIAIPHPMAPGMPMLVLQTNPAVSANCLETQGLAGGPLGPSLQGARRERGPRAPWQG